MLQCVYRIHFMQTSTKGTVCIIICQEESICQKSELVLNKFTLKNKITSFQQLTLEPNYLCAYKWGKYFFLVTVQNSGLGKRDNNRCSLHWGLFHAAAESIRAGNARPNSVVVANVKLYFTACGKCSMCEQQKYCLISLVLTNPEQPQRKSTAPFPEQHSFSQIF